VLFVEVHDFAMAEAIAVGHGIVASALCVAFETLRARAQMVSIKI